MTARADEGAGLCRWSLACMAVALAAAQLIFVPCALAQAAVLEVFTLKYRTAEQVIPVIQPMLRAGGSISGLQSQLIVRTSAGNLEEIRRILASVDALPRRLVITVKQDADGDSARARITDTRQVDSDHNLQTVQVLEGNAAFIRIGQSVPVPRQQVVQTVIGGQVVTQVVDNVEYRDVGTGFHVLPRVTGDRVTLDINPQHDTLNRQLPGAVNMQNVATTVSGRLGEWIEIAGLAQDHSRDQSALLGRASASGSDNRRVLIKVDEVR